MPHSIAAVSAVLRFLPDKKGHKKWQDSLAGKIKKNEGFSLMGKSMKQQKKNGEIVYKTKVLIRKLLN